MARCAAGLFDGGLRLPLPNLSWHAAVPAPEAFLVNANKRPDANCVLLWDCATGVGESHKLWFCIMNYFILQVFFVSMQKNSSMRLLFQNLGKVQN
jgi:hypothetical protein